MNLVSADRVALRINRTSRNDFIFTGNDLRDRPNNHGLGDVHCIGITSLSNADNISILNPNICLVGQSQIQEKINIPYKCRYNQR